MRSIAPGSNGLKEQPFAVVARVLVQDIVYGIGVAEEIDGTGQGGQPHDVAKLLAESEIFRQGAPPHPAQAVPERHAAGARSTRERLAAGHGYPFLWAGPSLQVVLAAYGLLS
jgi:hypothetical protein